MRVSVCLYMVRACPNCGQRFVSVLTETIDWVDGEDPQYWIMLPITAAEVADLIEQGSALTEAAAFNSLGPDRKSLCHDYPKGEQPHNHWGMGLYVRQHD